MIVAPFLVVRFILFRGVFQFSRVNATHFCNRVMGGFAYFAARTCIGSFPCIATAMKVAASALTCTVFTYGY